MNSMKTVKLNGIEFKAEKNALNDKYTALSIKNSEKLRKVIRIAEDNDFQKHSLIIKRGSNELVIAVSQGKFIDTRYFKYPYEVDVEFED